MEEFAEKYLEEFIDSLKKINLGKIEWMGDLLIEAYQKEKTIYIMGNGGSSSIASHFACDLAKGTISNFLDEKKKRFKVQCLNDNLPLITAYGNDLGYDYVFSQQLANSVKEGDVVIVISASGNSKNILEALITAKKKGAMSVGLLGFDGGKAAQIVDQKIVIDNQHYGQIEDIHMVLLHLLANYLKEEVKKLI